jgi:hypothetical protein
MEVDVKKNDAMTHTISTDVAAVTISGEPKLGDAVARDRGAFVEVLDKHDSVMHRARYERLPITIGNTYRCDHVVDSDDPRPQSVVLDRDDDDALIVRGEVAHQKFWAPGGSTQQWRVNADQAFLLAGERIRIRTRDYAPAKASAQPSAIRRLSGWATPIAVAAALGITALQGWLGDIDGDRLSKYVTGALGIFGAIAIWAGIWALVSRLNGRSSHFLSHLSLASIGVVAITVIDYAFDSAAFAFNWSTLAKYGYVLFAMCIGVLVWGHTRYIVRARAGVAMTTAVAFAVAMFTTQATTFFNLRGGLASSLTMNEMRPPAWRVVDGASIDDFFAKSEALQKRAEDSKPEKPDGIDFSSYVE